MLSGMYSFDGVFGLWHSLAPWARGGRRGRAAGCNVLVRDEDEPQQTQPVVGGGTRRIHLGRVGGHFYALALVTLQSWGYVRVCARGQNELVMLEGIETLRNGRPSLSLHESSCVHGTDGVIHKVSWCVYGPHSFPP